MYFSNSPSNLARKDGSRWGAWNSIGHESWVAFGGSALGKDVCISLETLCRSQIGSQVLQSDKLQSRMHMIQPSVLSNNIAYFICLTIGVYIRVFKTDSPSLMILCVFHSGLRYWSIEKPFLPLKDLRTCLRAFLSWIEVICFWRQSY